ncbi:MAG: TolC family protein [Prolixibacteraceae bacterium]
MNRKPKFMHKGKETVLIVLFFSILHSSYAQMDLRSLLVLAEKNYPAITAKQAEAEAARVNVSLEKNKMLPSLDAAYQVNYSTYNNITGMSYPGNLMPISGPPTDDNYDAVPGSAASMTLKWSPITFGRRSASVGYHEKLYEKELAGVKDEVLRVKFQVAFTYLEIAATRELIKAYEKNVARTEFNLKKISSLVRTGIRPAVDSLMFKGELSKTRVALYDLQNQLETQKQELAELLVTEELKDLTINDFIFKSLPTPQLQTDSIQNPMLHMAMFDVEAQKFSLTQIKRSWAPSIEFWSTVYGRGSGIGFDGTIDKQDGWSFSRYNYGVGLQLVFPILDLTNVSLRTRQQNAKLESSRNYLHQTQINLKRQELTAAGNLTTSLKIAKEVPLEFEANESAYKALQIRYNSGLVDYTALIQAQYDLLNAEARLKNAYINSWKSLLKMAVIRGDMNIFLNQIQN